ncbi:MAG: L,D-transpeptidase family protein [Lachnospiraceae bacterium]|nr:L,D-transpeptidase family protein [Lachnospiraceae bacterium]
MMTHTVFPTASVQETKRPDQLMTSPVSDRHTCRNRKSRPALTRLLLTLLVLISVFAMTAQAASMPRKAPAKVTGLKVTNLNQSARLTWKKSSKVSGYEVWIREKGAADFSLLKVTTKNSLKITGLKNQTVYSVKVKAFRKFSAKDIYQGAFSSVKSLKPNVVKIPAVHDLWYKAALKSSVEMEAVNSDKKLRLGAGKEVVLVSTTAGTSMVKYGGKLYYVPRSKLRLTGMKTHQKPYKKDDVTKYVNEKGFYSKTKFMIYVSAYTQHIYLFTGKKGEWKLKFSSRCSTGKFSTQTNYGRTFICGKQMDWYFDGYVCAHYASMVWSGGQAFHTWATGVGWPASHGCIRLPRQYAIYIYNNVPVGTGVYVY